MSAATNDRSLEDGRVWADDLPSHTPLWHELPSSRRLLRFMRVGYSVSAAMVAVGTIAGYAIGLGGIARVSANITATALVVGSSIAVAAFLYAGVHFSLLRSFAKALRQLNEQNRRFDVMLNNMSQGVCFFDKQQNLILANRRYAEIYGLPLSSITPGTSLDAIVAARFDANTAPNMSEEEYFNLRARAEGLNRPSDTMVELCNGLVISIHHRSMAHGGWVATHEDITERRLAEEQMVFMARHDPLTGLPNRQRFHECMIDATATQQEGEHVAVLCLDLDRFKAVNDTFGHPIGDALLCAVADRLSGCIRKQDLVVRLGGDEFAIVQVAAEQPFRARALAHRIIDVLGQPFDLGENQVVIGVSIGIALGQVGADADLLLKNADLALYRAKADGRGNCCIFRPELREVMHTRSAMEADLRIALAEQQFELFYQPLLDAETETIRSVEALLRWRHPVRGLVSPIEFIPLAEEIGLIVPLGEWVLNQACQQAMSWPQSIKVAVNLSAVQFRSDLVAATRDALKLSGLEPSRLELEITESVLLQNSEATLITLHELRELGVRFGLDDFGTGYSSLSYLRSFPFDKMKIDKSFVRDLGQERDSLAIIRAAIYLARELGISVTAEGVETVEQFAQLKAEGCSEVQGFLFSAPVPAPELGRLFPVSVSYVPNAVITPPKSGRRQDLRSLDTYPYDHATKPPDTQVA